MRPTLRSSQAAPASCSSRRDRWRTPKRCSATRSRNRNPSEQHVLLATSAGWSGGELLTRLTGVKTPSELRNMPAAAATSGLGVDDELEDLRRRVVAVRNWGVSGGAKCLLRGRCKMPLGAGCADATFRPDGHVHHRARSAVSRIRAVARERARGTGRSSGHARHRHGDNAGRSRARLGSRSCAQRSASRAGTCGVW